MSSETNSEQQELIALMRIGDIPATVNNKSVYRRSNNRGLYIKVNKHTHIKVEFVDQIDGEKQWRPINRPEQLDENEEVEIVEYNAITGRGKPETVEIWIEDKTALTRTFLQHSALWLIIISITMWFISYDMLYVNYVLTASVTLMLAEAIIVYFFSRQSGATKDAAKMRFGAYLMITIIYLL